MLANMKLTTKVFNTLFISILGMFIIAISSYIGFSKIGSELEEIAEYQVPMNKIITELEASILKEEILTYELIIESKNIKSEQFLELEKKILKLEKKTNKLIKNAEDIVEEAINHNKDEKTKSIYKLFFTELKILEKEQKKFKQILFDFEKRLKKNLIKDISEDKNILHKQLSLMDENIINLMHKMEDLLASSTLQAEKDEIMALRTIEIISFITLIISSLIAYFLIKQIRNKITSFQNSFESFFDFLNRKSENINYAEDKNTDEFGKMSKVLNENINITKEHIQEDRKVIDETIAVLSEFEKGDLYKRVDIKCSNPALNELTKLLNQMGDNLEHNIDDILSILEEYTNKNYMNRVKIEGLKEHLSKLSTGINSLGEAITSSLQLRKRNALILSSNADTLKENVTSLSTSSSEAAASLEETSAAIEEITSTITSNAQKVSQMAQYTSKVTNAASKGEKLANNTMTAMDEINNQVQSINEAITVIDQIAFQTNILSLNAAVEAATAGEAGKGFAVVAGEVRNLASRSAQAAKEIKNIVEAASIKANEGKEITKDMFISYEDLNKDITKTLELITSIDDASKEQKLGIEQINDAVNQIDQQTQLNSSAALVTNDIATTTENLSKTMINSINKNQFRDKEEIVDRRAQCRDLNYSGIERRKTEKTIKENCEIRFNKKEEKTTQEDNWENF